MPGKPRKRLRGGFTGRLRFRRWAARPRNRLRGYICWEVGCRSTCGEGLAHTFAAPTLTPALSLPGRGCRKSMSGAQPLVADDPESAQPRRSRRMRAAEGEVYPVVDRLVALELIVDGEPGEADGGDEPEPRQLVGPQGVPDRPRIRRRHEQHEDRRGCRGSSRSARSARSTPKLGIFTACVQFMDRCKNKSRIPASLLPPTLGRTTRPAMRKAVAPAGCARWV